MRRFFLSTLPDGKTGEIMNDETAVTPEAQAQDAANAQPAPDATGEKAEAVKTFTQAELDAIVRERIDRERRKADEATKKAAAEAETRALAEQGKYKELADSLKAELDATKAQAKALELAALKRDIAAEVGLPGALAARLQGDDADAIKADAQALIASLPKPTAPNLNSAQGANAVPANAKYGGLTEQEFASIFGVNPKYINQ